MTERIVAAVEGREVDRRRGDYLGKVVCFLARCSSSTMSTRPSRNQLRHLGKIVFNKTYRHTVPKGRV